MDFANPINLAVAGVPLVIAIANFTMVFGEVVFEGIALGSFAALAIHHVLSAIARFRGTDVGFGTDDEALATPVNESDLSRREEDDPRRP